MILSYFTKPLDFHWKFWHSHLGGPEGPGRRLIPYYRQTPHVIRGINAVGRYPESR